MYVPDNAPPLAIYCAPYGGLGLKTKSFAAALARIEGLLSASTEVVQDLAELTVLEPASRALVEALNGAFDRDTAGRSGGGERTDLAAAVTTHGHVHDAVAGEAWQRFGEPNRIGGRQQRGGLFFIEWRWEVTEVDVAEQRLAEFAPYVSSHDQLMFDDYSTRIEARGGWDMRLRVAGGKVVAPPYPPSSVRANLRGKHASAFLDFVLPHVAATDAFLADYQAVNRALGITVPMKGYKLCAPKKKGGGRVYKRLPDA